MNVQKNSAGADVERGKSRGDGTAAQYQVFHIKNTTLFFLDRQSPPRHRPIKASSPAAQRAAMINTGENKKRFKAASSVSIKKKKKKKKKTKKLQGSSTSSTNH
ncbi:hypothetical protein LINGRAHAP2_LOCUS30099 [Linum grandiflorum]